MFALGLNIFLFLITTLHIYRKDHCFSIRIAVLFMYLILAIMGFITVYNGIFFEEFGFYNKENISIIPFVFNYLMVVLLLNSTKGHVNISNYINVFPLIKLKWRNRFEIVISLLCLLYLILSVFWFKKYGGVDFVDIYTSNRAGEHDYVFSNRFLNIFFFRTYQILLWVTPFFCLLEFVKLIHKIKRRQSILLIILFYVCMFVGCLIQANRGGFIFISANALFFIIIFWKYFSHNVKRNLLIVGGVMIAIIVFFTIGITISRSSDDTELAFFGAIRYMGESFPNLGFRVWDTSGEHIMGARKFPFLFQALGGYIPDFEGNHYDYVFYYETKYKYPINNFQTFFGDIYAEFGIVLSFLIVICYVLLIKEIIKKTSDSILSIVFVYVTYTLLIWGGFNCKISEGFIIELLLYVISVFVIKRLFFNKKKIVRNENNDSNTSI